MTASNSSGFFAGPHVTVSPAPVTTSSSSTWSPWVPCRKDATPIPAMESVPPTVTFRLLVSTGGASRSGRSRSRRSPHSTPASTSAVSRSSSTAITRSREDIASRMPPSDKPRWLWLWPAPRVETVSPSSRAKRIVAPTSSIARGSTRRRGVERNTWPKLVVRSSSTSPASRTAPVTDFFSLSRSALTDPRAAQVHQEQDLAEVAREVLEHVVVVPAHVEHPLGAVRTFPRELALHVIVGTALRHLLEVRAAPVEQVVVEGEVLPVQERERRRFLRDRQPVVILADPEHAEYLGGLVALDDHLRPPDLHDREMREEHPDGVHARRGLPHEVFGCEVARPLTEKPELIVELRQERARLPGSELGERRHDGADDRLHLASNSNWPASRERPTPAAAESRELVRAAFRSAGRDPAPCERPRECFEDRR